MNVVIGRPEVGAEGDYPALRKHGGIAALGEMDPQQLQDNQQCELLVAGPEQA